MPVDDRDVGPTGLPPETEENATAPSAPLPEGDESPAPRSRWRRYVTRRNAIFAGIAVALAIVLLLVVVIIIIRSGQLDRLIANQIVRTLAEYNIRAEVKDFHLKFSPRTVEVQGLALYDPQTNQQLGKVDRLLATVRIEDLYALNLRRNVNLESLEIDGLELWVLFDEQGRSNFDNIKLPAPDPNRRILFSYSTARAKLNNAVIHYGDARHDISGEARNVRATIQPDDPNAPAESWMNTVTLALSNSTFVYDGRPVNNIDVEARGRINQTRAEIQEVILRSPVAEARLQGTMDDWRALRYQLQATATVDLTQTSDWLQTSTTMRGAGKFVGTVTGEGDHYQVDGQIQSDALAADGVRLKALTVNARGSGDGDLNYNAQARAVAELLTAGDFQLNAIQMQGGVMGTGTDFRWMGDLRAAAARYTDSTSITGLIVSDAVAEMRDGRISGSAPRVAANSLTSSGASVRGVQASGVRFAQEGDVINASVASAGVGTVVASGARINGVTATGITAVNRDNATNITVDNVRVGGADAAGAQVGSLNIAGVRLAISNSGRVEGSSGDINVGTVGFNGGDTLGSGRAENVRLARPVFTVEPGGRYRASADLSLGGGVLGQMKLGPARSAVVATSSQIQLNNLTAEAFNGRISGNATVSTTRSGASRISAQFTGVDVGGLIAAFSGNVVPLTGGATGSVDLQFPGTNFEAASGTLNAQFNGETGNETRGRTPLSGEVALRADRGLFQLERANLRTAASELNASGQFSLSRDSNLQINLTSTDAAELQRVLLASGLIPDLEENLTSYGLEVAGKLDFNGTVRGKLTEPQVNGRASLASLRVNGRDLGALSASIDSTATEVRVTDGRLTQPGGGDAQFAINMPLYGKDNISVEATLDRIDVGNLLAALPGGQNAGTSTASTARTQLAGVGPASGRISVTGIPGAMSGSADLRAGPGRIGNEPFDAITARATFNGSNITLENLDARFRAGQLTASGTFNTESTAFDLRAQGNGVRLDIVSSLTGGGGAVPQLAGTVDFTASASGNLKNTRSYQVALNGQGHDVTINGQAAGTLAVVGRTVGQQFNLELTTGLLGKPQVIAARVDLSKDELPATIETALTDTDLTPLFATLMPGSNVRVSGRATGTLKASGNLFGEEGFSVAALRGTANFTELAFQIQDVQLAAERPLIVQFSPEEITFEKTRFTGQGTNILFGGTMALGAGGRQNFSVDGELNLRVLNSLSPNNFFGGTARVGVRVGGTYADPRITGTAEIAGASVSTLVVNERLSVSSINGRIIFNADRAEIQSLTGILGGGHITVSGGAVLAGFVPSQFRVSVRADDVTVPLPNDIRATTDADLVAQGSLEAQLLRGVVNLRRVEYMKDIELADIINRRQEASITEGGGEGTFGATTQLDLQVEGRDALVVRNNLADMVGSVALQIRGSADDPIISGRITATRGTLNFRRDRYELTRAYIDLPPRRDADPILNIQAESEIKGYRVIVGLTGPLSQPQAIVRSDPALPQADVVSLITTGNLSSDETADSSLSQTGLGTAASLLTDTLINSPVKRATDRLFGLNRFEIDPLIAGRAGASPTARLTVGRQINRNLSLTYSTNVTQDPNPVVALEYRVSNRLSFVAQYEQPPVNSFRGRSNVFSFEIRFRRRF